MPTASLAVASATAAIATASFRDSRVTASAIHADGCLALATLDEMNGKFERSISLTSRSTAREIAEADAFANSVDAGRAIVAAVGPGSEALLTASIRRLLENAGSAEVGQYSDASKFAFIGRRGLPQGAAVERLTAEGESFESVDLGPAPLLLHLYVHSNATEGGIRNGHTEIDRTEGASNKRLVLISFAETGAVESVQKFSAEELMAGQASAWAASLQRGQVIAGYSVGGLPVLPRELLDVFRASGARRLEKTTPGTHWAFAGLFQGAEARASECTCYAPHQSVARLLVQGPILSGPGYSIRAEWGGERRPLLAVGSVPVSFDSGLLYGPNTQARGIVYLAHVDDLSGKIVRASELIVDDWRFRMDLKLWTGLLRQGDVVIGLFRLSGGAELDGDTATLLSRMGCALPQQPDQDTGLFFVGRWGAAPGSAIEMRLRRSDVSTFAMWRDGLAARAVPMHIDVSLPAGGTTCTVRTFRGHHSLAPLAADGVTMVVLDGLTSELVGQRVLLPTAEEEDVDRFFESIETLRAPRRMLVGFTMQAFYPSPPVAVHLQRLGLRMLNARRGDRWSCALDWQPPVIASGASVEATASTGRDLHLIFDPFQSNFGGELQPTRVELQLQDDLEASVTADGAQVLKESHRSHELIAVRLPLRAGESATVTRLPPVTDAATAESFRAWVRHTHLGTPVVVVMRATGLDRSWELVPDALMAIGGDPSMAAPGARQWVLLGTRGTGRGTGRQWHGAHADVAATAYLLRTHRPGHGKRLGPALVVGVIVTFAIVLASYMLYRPRWFGYRDLTTPTPLPSRRQRRLNESTFLVAHNAFATWSRDGLRPDASQRISLEEMLALGVRGFMLDIAVKDGELWLCHGTCLVYSQPLREALAVFSQFLKDHPDEVLFAFIDSPGGWLPDEASNRLFARTLKDTELLHQLWSPDGLDLAAEEDRLLGIPTAPQQIPAVQQTANGADIWPLYSALVDANRRFVMWVDRNQGTPSSVTHLLPFIWEHVRETDFTGFGPSPSERVQSAGRRAGRSMSLMNHWSTAFGEDYDMHVNQWRTIVERSLGAFTLFNRVPNFIALDFVDLGNGLDVVNEINRRIWGPAAADAQKGAPWDTERFRRESRGLIP